MVHELLSGMSLLLITCQRVIQLIDENKEQLRNLFRKYNVVDVQPAVTDKLPDDISTLQVWETATFTNLFVIFLCFINFKCLNFLFL